MTDSVIRTWTQRVNEKVFYHYIDIVNHQKLPVFMRVYDDFKKARELVNDVQQLLKLVGESLSIEGEFFDVRADPKNQYAWPGYVNNVLLPLEAKWLKSLTYFEIAK